MFVPIPSCVKFFGVALLLFVLVGCSKMAERKPLLAAPGMENFIPGTGSVHLGMTEQEVIDTFGFQPAQRESSPNTRTEVLAFKVPAQQKGQIEGNAVAVFVGGPLVRITFGPDITKILQDLPRIDVKVGRDLARHELALKLLRHEMTLKEVESHAGGPGRLVLWTLQQNGPAKDAIRTEWLWQLEGTDQVLILEAQDGVPEQPMLRDISTLSAQGHNDAK